MFDIGASELLVIFVVAVIVIGPKDLPLALRTAGRFIGRMRRMTNHVRAGLGEMIRQAEMEEIEKEWAERNKAIMARYPDGSEPAGGAPETAGSFAAAPQMEPLAAPAEESATAAATSTASSDPELPLAPRKAD